MIKILFILNSFSVLPLLSGCHGQCAGLLCSNHHKKLEDCKDSIISMATLNVYFRSLPSGSAHFIFHYNEFGSVQCSRYGWRGCKLRSVFYVASVKVL